MTGSSLIETSLAFGFPGGWEWMVLLVIGLLIFGRRLPEVGRSLGRGIVEFKRGIKGIEDDIDTESSQSKSLPDDRREELQTPKEPEQREAVKTTADDDDVASR